MEFGQLPSQCAINQLPSPTHTSFSTVYRKLELTKLLSQLAIPQVLIIKNPLYTRHHSTSDPLEVRNGSGRILVVIKNEIKLF
jgi:hypothetical protein